MFNFNGKPSATRIIHTSYKLASLVALLGAVVVWISYRSYLTSQLSVEIKKYPFDDLNTLTESNYM